MCCITVLMRGLLLFLTRSSLQPTLVLCTYLLVQLYCVIAVVLLLHNLSVPGPSMHYMHT